MNIAERLSPLRLKIALIAIPVALAALYWLVIAADRYVSETTVAVRQANHEGSALPGIALLLGGVNPPAREDTLYLREYVHSLDLLRKLDAQLGLRKHFEEGTRDPIYRLHAGASQEWFLDYYRSRVEVQFDETTSLLTIRAQGFDPVFAQKLAQAILQESELFINGFSQRIAREQMAFAEGELQRAATRLQESKAKVLAFQVKNKLLDPTSQARASSVLVAELQAAVAKQETELRTLRSYLNEDAYPVQSARAQLEAMRRQLESENLRGVAGGDNAKLNEMVAQFRDLGLQAGFAEDVYKLSLTAVENARIDATRKLKNLVVLQSPALPEIAAYPRRLYNLVTLFVVCWLLYGLTRLVVATIRDHQD